ncbi:MAG: indole-3-glycerol phosphate synthase TrpC, partial [Lachnospiraceae bacterium]|nr:indole-3-glycerol phosphate synthase TrpC [Lachnospiraceae bacterium]
IAKEYEAAGADCISVLTEPEWFMGKDDHLKEISAEVSVPCLRKDFTIDDYMIYEAKLLGASAVLLICAILSGEQLKTYIEVCDSLGISALVEAHDEREIELALDAGSRVIGVNNRNLKDFSVDTGNSRRLRSLVPENVIFVSESGVKNSTDVRRLKEIGADAVLVGETLMRAGDKKTALRELKGVE